MPKRVKPKEKRPPKTGDYSPAADKPAKRSCPHIHVMVTRTGYGDNERCMDCGEEIGYV